MSTATETAALVKQLKAFRNAARKKTAKSLERFYTDNTDFRGTKGFAQGFQKTATSTGSAGFKLRSSAETAHVKWLADGVALVDSVTDSGNQRSWFTELWQKQDGKYQIRSSRLRSGNSNRAYSALNRLKSAVQAEGLQGAVASREERKLRKNFKAFRQAFNKGDGKKMLALWSPDCDAVPVFSFLNGRAQVLNGRMAVGAKADRMNPGATVSNPDPARGGAAIVAGEPKVVRFLTPKLAVVDGTADINGIPAAHGFAPKRMKGVYTDFWRKVGNNWLIESSRAWF